MYPWSCPWSMYHPQGGWHYGGMDQGVNSFTTIMNRRTLIIECTWQLMLTYSKTCHFNFGISLIVFIIYKRLHAFICKINPKVQQLVATLSTDPPGYKSRAIHLYAKTELFCPWMHPDFLPQLYKRNTNFWQYKCGLKWHQIGMPRSSWSTKVRSWRLHKWCLSRRE